MKILERSITLASQYRPLTIGSIGDIHFGNDDLSVSHLQAAVAELEDTPDCYWVGTGDYTDFCRATARRYIKAYQGDSTSLQPLNKIATDFEGELYRRYLRRIQARCLGIIEGNHFWETECGVSTGQRLAERMGCPYLYDQGGITLHVNRKDGKSIRTFLILLNHGSGSSYTTPGGDLNALIRKGKSWLVDMSFNAHTHKKIGYTQPLLTWARTGRLEVEEVPHAYIRTGGYVRAYRECDERGRYTEQKQVDPVDLGHVIVTIEFYQEYLAELRREQRTRHPGFGNGAGKLKYRLRCTY